MGCDCDQALLRNENPTVHLYQQSYEALLAMSNANPQAVAARYLSAIAGLSVSMPYFGVQFHVDAPPIPAPSAVAVPPPVTMTCC